MPRTRSRRFRTSLAVRGAVVQLVALLIVSTVAFGGLYLLLRQSAAQSASRQTRALAVALAQMPQVQQAYRSSSPAEQLQPIATSIERSARVLFIVFMRPDGLRLTHPDPGMVGLPYVGDIAPALSGGEVTHIHAGTLGLSLRTVVPIHQPDTAEPIGLVSVGVGLAEIGQDVSGWLPYVIAASLVGTVLIGVVTLFAAHRFSRATHGMASSELDDLFEYYQAALHSIGEGLVLLDLGGRVQIINDEAARLLGCEASPGTAPEHLDLPAELSQALASDQDHDGEVFAVRGRLVSMQKIRASFEGHHRGTVVVLRDRTDLELIAGERDAARMQAEALHTQAHESSNRLHTVVSLMELGESQRAVDYAMRQLNSTRVLLEQDLGAIRSPEVAALLLGKAAKASDLGISFSVDPESELSEGAVSGPDAVLVLGNLVDNAFDAVAGQDNAEVQVAIYPDGHQIVFEVADSGPGVADQDRQRLLERGFTTKGPGHGLGLYLVSQCATRLGGMISFGGPPGAIVSVRIPEQKR